ncbi:MAG: hypothetical protein AAGU05_07680, partial [Anaerolineaceae bacterium]
MKTEPGSYVSLRARLNGVLSGNTFLKSQYSFGFMRGVTAIARSSPLVGSITMAVPDWAPLFETASSRMRSTIAWISRSMVSTRLEPG